MSPMHASQSELLNKMSIAFTIFSLVIFVMLFSFNICKYFSWLSIIFCSTFFDSEILEKSLSFNPFFKFSNPSLLMI